jgi:hypothetical protein
VEEQSLELIRKGEDMADWKTVCLDTIKQKGWTLCDWDRVCKVIQDAIDGYCGANEKAPGTPVPQVQDGKLCYCCCSCFAYDIPILVSEGVYEPIQNIEKHQTILSTGPALKAWTPREVTYSGGMGPNLSFSFTYHLSYKYEVGEEKERSMIVTADHLYLMDDGKVKAVQMLLPGDKLRRADGGISEVILSVRGDYVGGLHHITLGDFDGKDLNGHLINANGLVSSDYIVQLCYSSGNLDPNLIAETSSKAMAETAAFSKAALEFINDRSRWPQGFTPLVPSSQFNIPVFARRFLTDDQAEEVRDKGEFASPANLASLSQAGYLYSIYDALGPDILYINDWNNPVPNAYSWLAGGQRIIVTTGPLLRLYGMSLEGIALIVAHMVATQQNIECVGEADYAATYNYFRKFWLDDLFFIMFERALTQIKALFALITEHGHGNPKQPCHDPSLACRIKAFENGAAMLGVPECAEPKHPFGVIGATSNFQNTQVQVSFSRKLNPPSAETAANYAINPLEPQTPILVEKAVLEKPRDKMVLLTVKGLQSGKRYELKVQNVLSAKDEPLDPHRTKVTFETRILRK